MIVPNKAFIAKNSATAKFFKVMSVSVNGVSAQNLKMEEKGEGGWKVAEYHADARICANHKTFDSWLEATRSAAK